MNPAEVLARFPEEQIYEDWMGGNLNDALLFHGLIFLFDRCDSTGPLPDARMDEFIVHGRDDVRLWHRPVASWSRDSVMNYLLEKNLQFYALGGSPIQVITQSLTLNFTENGELNEVIGGRVY